MKNILFSLLLLGVHSLFAQEYFPKNDGVKTSPNTLVALKNATIVVSPTQTITSGNMLLKDGKILAIGTSIDTPKEAVVIDLHGKHIYPSFIDVYSSFGVTQPQRESRSGRSAQYEPSRSGYYWNDHIMPEKDALDSYTFDTKAANELLKTGFGVVNSHIQDGIMRGTGILVALNAEGNDSQRIIETQSAHYLSFSKSVTSNQSYPGSIMGSMALLRQVYLDADWYAKGGSKTKDLSLEAFNRNKKLPQIFFAGSRAQDLRVSKLANEHNMKFTIVGGGDEYERIDEIKNTKSTYILPVNFPDAYNVEDPYLTDHVSLNAMRQWNQSPYNLKIFADNAIPFALTLHSLKSPKNFMENLRKAIASGLSKEKALEALTLVPAKILGKEQTLGTLEVGKLANFTITSGDIFDEETTIYEHWVLGQQHQFEDLTRPDIRGDYTFSLFGNNYKMSFKGKLDKLKSEIVLNDSIKPDSKVVYNENWAHITITSGDSISKGFIRIAAQVETNKNLKGKAFLEDGSEASFFATHSAKDDKKSTSDEKKSKDSTKAMFPVSFPNTAYGFETLPKAETILFKNATVWTSEKTGVLENTDVLLKDGKIAKIGQNLSSQGAKIIDATGKHLTAGIIDEHSHIATSSVNESGQNSSAEVSIEDVLDDTDMDIYRNLSGGVTSIQVLHGSANPIGGRSAIIKLKWGESAENLVYKNSPKFIKFALGENVKQSNWQSYSRFPQTRMGVEQVYVDYFTRAQEYDALKKSGKPYRKDIEMEVLAEILNKERFISCHSYVQSEINMLMKVAERFNFNINTFTHILEGYKVADKMKAHGVGASTFSDWWAYKFEVNDAIPFNASILNEVGVITAINSDDAEMSRRLNQEAAKSVKYGNTSEEDAWKFVTINPAKLLHIDNRVGSIKEGKDADVVLWTDHPLSIYAKAEYTIIEGAVYYSMERDAVMLSKIKDERNKLICLMMEDKNKGMKTQPIKKKEDKDFHCDTLDNE